MSLESGTYIDSLVVTNPTASDPKSEGDDHIRLLKSTVKATFPNVTEAVTATAAELNFSDGVTSAVQGQIDEKSPIAGPGSAQAFATGALTVTGGINSTTGAELATSSGNVLIGTTTDDGTNKLQVNGSVTITGANALRGSYGGGGVTTNFAVGDGALQSNTTTVATLGAITGGTGYTANLTAVAATLSYASGSTATTYPPVLITTDAAGVVTACTLVVAANGTKGGTGFKDITTVMSCTSIGAGTGFAISPATLATGNSNTANGMYALYNNTTGVRNTASGYRALYSNTTGNYNTASGYQALFNNTTGNSNTANGMSALFNNTTGSGNTASGMYALRYNTTGIRNTASGMYALYSNTTGSYNTTSGYRALFNNTTGNSNTASGYRALYSNTTGTYNTASGMYALYYNTTGIRNTASGYQALFNNTTGSYNTASGMQALRYNTTGSGNTAFNPLNSAGIYAPVFDPTVENDRLCMGSTGVTNAYVQVAWTVVSDARDKTDFAPVPHGLDFVSKLQPTAYRYKMNREDTEGHGPVRYGFLAQEVLELEGETPVIVDAEDLDKLRFNDQAMIAVLANALRELNAKFDVYVSTHP
jgi:hypothetical protein